MRVINFREGKTIFIEMNLCTCCIDFSRYESLQLFFFREKISNGNFYYLLRHYLSSNVGLFMNYD